jgi:hypothetical protein
MKHVEVTHNLSLIYEALKTNKAAWDKFNTKIKALKATDSTESNKKMLWDITVQQAQVYAVIVLLTNSMIEALANCYLGRKM